MQPPKGFIFYERFLDGETIRVRAYMHREGLPPEVCLIDPERLTQTACQELLIHNDLKGVGRL